MNIVVYLKLEKNYRAYAKVDGSTCENCGICAKICPFDVPDSIQDGSTEISPETCKGCGACVPYCKTNSIHMHYTLNSKPYEPGKFASLGLRYPLDRNAIEAGLALRDELGGNVRILAEGSPRFEESVREGLVMGADEGILLCDRKFLGSDHWASSIVLEKSLKKLGDCDLLIAPQRNGYGEQLLCVAWVAERLGMSYMPFVTSIKPAGDSLIVRRNGPTSLLELSVSLPAAVTVERGINEPRGLSLLAASRVMGRKVPYWTSEDLNTEDSQTGELGSCLRLARVQAPPKRKIKRRQGGQILRGSPEVLAEILVERLKEWHAR